MASFESLYNDIEYKVKAATIRIAELNDENQKLRDRNTALEIERKHLEKQLEEAEEKIKLLVITKTVLEKKDNTDTKQQINDWVREIDYCIKLLSNK